MTPLQPTRLCLLAASLLVAACSVSDPVPSRAFDGRYAGARVSDRADACGVTSLRGKTAARIQDGLVVIDLFSAKTRMTGSVGEDGRLRASGIWANPTGGFPGVTVLNGAIRSGILDGIATDFRCHTDVHLRRIPASLPRRLP